MNAFNPAHFRAQFPALADAGVFPHVIAPSSSAPETTVARIHGIAHA